jgi:primosomal replication protein N
MDEMQTNNRVFLCGSPLSEPVYSHMGRQERFYQFTLEVVRLSGTADRLNVIVRESQLSDVRPARSGLLEVWGELRSFNNRSGEGRKLVITVFARGLYPASEPVWENRVELIGTLCRPPVLRQTPMGREICDLLLAVNRHYGRSDYLPCIAWGQNARRAAVWNTGQRLELTGRIQSRDYMKNLDGEAVKRTAFEVSVSTIEPVEAEEQPR